MKRVLVAVAAAGIVFAAMEMSMSHAPEVIVPSLVLRFLLALSLLTAALCLSRFGARSDQPAGGGAGRILAILCMVGAAFFALYRAVAVDEDELALRFHKLYHSKNSHLSSYLGVRCLQYPTDQWVMQELISEIKPDFIVETGTFSGATTLFYSQILSQVNPDGRIMTVDIAPLGQQAPRFPAWDERIEFIRGDSVGATTLERIRAQVEGRTVLITLDSLHTTEHVARELEAYASLVSVGSYIVVQDTHLGGHPNDHPSQEGDPGPMPAVLDFLKRHPDFEADRSLEKHLFTQNPSGYLRRVR